MAIGLADLDRQIARVYAEHAVTVPNGDRLPPVAAPAAGTASTMFYWLLGGVLGGLSVSGIATAADPSSPAGLLLGLCVGAAAIAFGVLEHEQWSDRLRVTLEPQVLRAIGERDSLSRAERSYCEAASLLLESGRYFKEPEQREILEHLNKLLASTRHMEEQRSRIRKAMAGDTVAQLEAERAELERRAARAQDDVARQALYQSVEMCDARLNGARSLTPSLERLDAQEEVVLQTFASVQSSLARLEVAPAELAAPDTVQIRESIAEISRQTRSVEDAVQEVLLLGR